MDDKSTRPPEALRLEEARKRRGFANAKAAAEYFGWNYDTYSQHERGERGLTRAAAKYAKALHVSRGWLLYGDEESPRATTVPIMGLIGGGAEIQPDLEQVPPDGIAEIELPFPVPDNLIGFEVRGDSMLPKYDEGDLIIVPREPKSDPRSMMNELAAVTIDTGKRYLKKLRPGSSPHKFNLESFNARTIEDVRVVWASTVWAVVPARQLRRLR